ncbi:MAG: hypothetical protein NTV34_01180 [Proteobacteria bacterium]|nr:hypothetical protein [Pseudomonadota bacterium]
MQREVKLIFAVLAAPVSLWILVSLFYGMRSLSNKGEKILHQRELVVWTHLVGGMQRYQNAFPLEKVVATVGSPRTWTGLSYTVNADSRTQEIFLDSKRFSKPVALKYDGWRWQGFANIHERKLPLKVEVWY